MGLAAAYWLTTLRPDLTIALLEKHTVANAAARWDSYASVKRVGAFLSLFITLQLAHKSKLTYACFALLAL